MSERKRKRPKWIYPERNPITWQDSSGKKPSCSKTAETLIGFYEVDFVFLQHIYPNTKLMENWHMHTLALRNEERNKERTREGEG